MPGDLDAAAVGPGGLDADVHGVGWEEAGDAGGPFDDGDGAGLLEQLAEADGFEVFASPTR
jgi:hypothetical protein